MPPSSKPIAVLLMAMGGPDCLENVEPFLLDVRGGRPTSPELVAEIKARYAATGGKSPAVGITFNLARKLETRLNESGHGRYRTYVGLRHWHPFIKDTLAQLLAGDPEHIIGFCLAPQTSSMSTGAYRKKVEEAQTLMNDEHSVSYVGSWNRHPKLIAAIVDKIQEGLNRFPPSVRGDVTVLFTAHSLPERIVAMNDPYPGEVKGTVAAATGLLDGQPTAFAYQSQGRSPEPWLGPTVESTIEELARAGKRHVLVAPIGFLCDHVETLYDIDIELKQLAAGRGIQLERMAMLNDSPAFIETLVDVISAHESSLTIPS
jgi:protoporphyrin/coproporphyrin ferrochelatase